MKNIKRKSAAALAAGMSVIFGAGTIALAAEQADSGISKEETVYINTEADGTVKEITVSEWLKNSGKASGSLIRDVSDLTDIRNTKGDEEYTQNGKNLTWENDGKDIHYEGKTEKDIPVTVKFTYELDGREISPDDLAGRSGHLKIHVTYQNNMKTTRKVNGKSAELYSPFMMITGMILSTDHFSNVTVDNGKVVEDDSRNIVLGIAMPGLKESLDLSEDMEDDIAVPEDFTMEADVTECEMTSSFTVAMTDVLDEVDLDDLDSIDDLEDSISKMTKAASKLSKGARSLYEGTDTLNSKYREFDEGIATLAEGASSLSSGAAKLNSGVETLAGGADALSSGASQLLQGVSAYTAGAGSLTAGVKQYVSGVATLNNSMPKLTEGVNSYTKGVDTYVSGGSRLADGVSSYVAGTLTLTDNVKKYIQAADGVTGNMVQYLKGMESLLNSMDKLVPGLGEALENTEKAVRQVQSLSSSINAEALGSISGDTEDYTKNVSAYNTRVQSYVEGVEQLVQKLSVLKDQISTAEGAETSEASEAARSAVDTLKRDADTMNTQAEAIDGWIAGQGAEQADTSAVDSGISGIKDNLSAAESALSGIDYSTMDEGTKAAVQVALGAVQAAKSSADSVDISSLKNQSADTTQLENAADTLKAAAAESSRESEKVQAASDSFGSLENTAASLGTVMSSLQETLDGLDKEAQALTAEGGSVKADGNSLSDTGKQLSDTMAGIKESFTALGKELPEIQKGISGLKDTADTLSRANEEIQNRYEDELAEGSIRLQKAAGNLTEAGKGITSGITSLQGKKNGNAKSLKNGAASLKKAERSLTSGSKQIREAIQKLRSGIQTLSANSSKLTEGADKLSVSGGQLNTGADKLASGAGTLASGTRSLKSGTSALSSGTDSLQSGADKLKDASTQVQEGISKLSSGAKSLSDGQSEFYKKGIKKLDDAVNKDLKDVIDRFKALKSEEVSCSSFTSRADGMDGSVKFIYETEPIEVSEED